MKVSAGILKQLALVLLALITTGSFAGDFKIFDGSAHEVVYITSSHGGQEELQELMRMVPGGEDVTVTKYANNSRFPCDINRDDEWECSQYRDDVDSSWEIMVVRAQSFYGGAVSIEDENDTEAINYVIEQIRHSAEWLYPQGVRCVFFHTGHYHENADPEELRDLYNFRLPFQKFAETNTDPRVYAIDALTRTREAFPIGVRTDGFHVSDEGNYMEGLEIVRSMCQHDSVPFPNEIEQYVDSIVAAKSVAAKIITDIFPDSAFAGTDIGVGNQLTIRWDADCDFINGVYLLMKVGTGGDDYWITTTPISCDDPEWGEYTYTIPDRAIEAKTEKGAFLQPSEEDEAPLDIHHKGTRSRIRVISSNLNESLEIFNFSSMFYLHQTPVSTKYRPARKHDTPPRSRSVGQSAIYDIRGRSLAPYGAKKAIQRLPHGVYISREERALRATVLD